MTGFDPAAARARCNAASAGPWRAVVDLSSGAKYATIVETSDGTGICYDALSDADAEFIAAARTDLPAALDRIEDLEGSAAEFERTCYTVLAERDAARAEVAALRAALETDFEFRVMCEPPGRSVQQWSVIRPTRTAIEMDAADARREGRWGEVWIEQRRVVGEWTRSAATVPDPADVSHCPHCARPLPHNETEQAACGATAPDPGEQR